MARASYLKEEEFNYIHLQRKKGKTVTEICKITSRSDKTVRKALNVHTYSEYVSGNKQERKERNEREARQKIIQQQLKVEDICELEATDIQNEHDDDNKPILELMQGSQLSAADKTELAKYIIDQHYFFLKQLTGVIK